MGDRRRIDQLENYVADLPAGTRERFEAIFEVSSLVGHCKCPASMTQWAVDRFGSVEAVETQRVVRVENKIAREGALFNPARALRSTTRLTSGDILHGLEGDRDPRSECAFCRAVETTPLDRFGTDAVERIVGKHCLTASNAGRYDARHALIIFNDHDPMAFDEQKIADYLDVANRWFRAALDQQAEFIYPFLLWNCLWRAGASTEHGHMQITMAQGRHYPKVELLRESAAAYRSEHGSDYFDDLFEIHTELGLAFEANGARVLLYLCPYRDKEIWIMAEQLDPATSKAVFRVLDALRQRAKVESFNLGILHRPLADGRKQQHLVEAWRNFPVVIRIVDRLAVSELPSDISGMSIFAGADAIASDPFSVIEALRA